MLPKASIIKPIPSGQKLTLTGKWQEEAGFKASKLVQVECHSNQLIITSIE